MGSLTREEALHRSSHVILHHQEVYIDLTHAADESHATYPVTSTLHLTSQVKALRIDVVADSLRVTVNGQDVQFIPYEDHIVVQNLPIGDEVTLAVYADCFYSRTGEGLHRYRDPLDDRNYLYTQFEPNDAHRAWPCLDQPDVKTSWQFTVTAPKDWVVATNTEAVTSENTEETTTHIFAPTLPLPAYITVLVAGDYSVIDGGEWTGKAAGTQDTEVTVPLRLMARQSLAQYVDSNDIFTVTRQGLDFYHANYGFTYQWGKYDQVFVPEYNLGAMENPGCVTFTEKFISTDAPTFAQRQRRANVILHEMCHMWFGDLVTPKWWDDLWLKESFADNQGAFAAAAATQYKGEWAVFATERKAWAYQQDLLPTTHPILANIPDVAAAKTNFDGITYAKGASVIKQLMAHVGKDAFFETARRFFVAHAYSNATMRDFIGILEEVTGREMSHWVRSWLGTSGPDTFRTVLETNSNRAISSFTLLREPNLNSNDVKPDDDAPRPHTLKISTWNAAQPRWQLIHTFDVSLEGDTVDVDPDRILCSSELSLDRRVIVVNDEDLTYAVTLLDDASQAEALTTLSLCPDPMTRAVIWSSLWLAVRMGKCCPADYVKAVVAHAPAETQPAVTHRLIDTARVALSRYTAPERREALAQSLLDDTLATVRSLRASRADEVRDWERLAIDMTRHTTTAEGMKFLHSCASFGAESDAMVSRENHWAALAVLAARGEITVDILDKKLKAEPSGENTIRHRFAVASLPDEVLHEELWQEALHADLSNDMLSATVTGLRSSKVWDVRDRDRFYNHVLAFWDSHSIGMGLRFVAGAFPDSPESNSHDEAVAWLEAHGELPAQLTRRMIEETFELGITQSIWSLQ